jgi:transposase
VYTWKAVLDQGGIDALRAMPTRGRPARLEEAQLQALRRMLLDKPTDHGFGAELWTLKRVGALIERQFGVKFSQTQIWRILGSLGFSVQKPARRAIERDEEAVQTCRRKTWLGPKKARREGRLIVFIDESGLNERPTRVRTWAKKGHTPVIQFHFNWTHISFIAGLTRTSCMFRLHEGSIKKEQHVEFLKALRAHLKQLLLIIWDGLKAHRSKLVRDYLDKRSGTGHRGSHGHGVAGATDLLYVDPERSELDPLRRIGPQGVGLAQQHCRFTLGQRCQQHLASGAAKERPQRAGLGDEAAFARRLHLTSTRAGGLWLECRAGFRVEDLNAQLGLDEGHSASICAGMTVFLWMRRPSGP